MYGLSMRMEMGGPDVSLRMEQQPQSKAYEAVAYWDRAPKASVELRVGDDRHTVEFCYAPSSWIDYMCPGEHFGMYTGNMMFLSAELLKDRPDWIPLVITKLYGERFIDEGLDQTGRVKHFGALFGTIRLAGQVMDADQLTEFLTELQKHERDGYFSLDREVAEFLDAFGGSSGDIKAAKRAYLKAHHGNKWVSRGRIAGELTTGGTGLYSGFRNHAEQCYSTFGNMDTRTAYLAAQFVHALETAEDGVPIVLEPEYAPLAFALTRQANGVVDLVEFIEADGNDADSNVIVKLSGRQRTWAALAKRCSFSLHRREEQVQFLLEDHRDRLDGLAIAVEEQSKALEAEADETRALVLAGSVPFTEAREQLAGLGARYADTLGRLDSASARVAATLSGLETLALELRRAI